MIDSNYTENTNNTSLAQSKQTRLVYLFRDLAFTFVIFWLINPQTIFSKVYNWNIYGAVLILWIVLAYVCEPSVFKNAVLNYRIVLIWLWPIYLFIASIVDHAEFSIKQLTMPFIFVFYLYYSRSKKRKYLSLCRIMTFSYMLVVFIVTIITNGTNPEISRYLAHGNVNETYVLSSPFLANFAYSYSIVGVSIAFCGISKLVRSNRRLHFISVLCFAFSAVTLVSTQYMLAIITVFVLSLWIVFMYEVKGDKQSYRINYKKIVFLLFALAVIIVFYSYIPYVLQSIADHTNGMNIKVRLQNIITILNGITNLSSMTRVELYTTSISTLFSSFSRFLFGVGYSAGYDLVGQHSQIFDTFARYGVIGGIAWCCTIIPAMKSVIYSLSNEASRIQKVVFVSLVIINFLNPCYFDLLLVFYFYIIPDLIEMFVNTHKDSVEKLL